MHAYPYSVCHILTSNSSRIFSFVEQNMTKTSTAESDYDFIFKIVIIGDSAVGKVRFIILKF